MIGTLETVPALSRPDLLAQPVIDALEHHRMDGVMVARIDPDLADTAAFCETYQVPMDISANCVVVAGKREGTQRVAACVVLATTRADVNNVVRKRLNVRKASFLAMEEAVEATGMEYGGITPIGLPVGWPILVDAVAVDIPYVIVGSGVRRSKIALPGKTLAALPNAEVVEGLGRPI